MRPKMSTATLSSYRRFRPEAPLPPLAERFGVRSGRQVWRDLRTVADHLLGEGRRLPAHERRFGVGVSSLGLLRPDLSLPAYAGLLPRDGMAPIFNLFDRVGGGAGYRARVTRESARDHRGGRLTYDEHDGTDFVCPPGTPLGCAAPGVLVALRDDWLRGGLTAIVDHGEGVVTQYTHLSAPVAEVGQPLARGETVALAGMAGLDMAHAFPWVPPHVHFMVWLDGRPVDPYLAPGEAPRAGSWMDPAAPRPSGPLADDPAPPRAERIAIDEGAVEALLGRCRSPEVRAEIERAPSAAARAAIAEDSLHHQRFAWAPDTFGTRLRPRGDGSRVRLTLPLPRSDYRGARFVDARWTRP
jgi:murein DD-endopeptidase MepM/ murein hydrolase activator NlpD